MSISFEITGSGIARFKARLARLGEAVTDLRPAWGAIVEDFKRIEQEQFDSQGGRATPWAPLNPRYAARKAARGGAGPVLVNRGDLRASLVGQTNTSILEETPMSLRMGTRERTAKYHQFGTRKMPKRRVIEITPKDQARWTGLIRHFLAESIKGGPS